jgi:predicted neuraminidase
MCVEQACRFEFSYPYLIRTQNGDFHLAYTWNRAFIKHLAFNRAWLERQISEAQ